MLNYLSSFFYSGTLVAGSKYVSTWMDPAFAPIVAGLPVGIVGSFFLDTEEAKKRYYAGFMYSSIVLAIAAFTMYMVILLFPGISMSAIGIIGLFLWALISLVTIYYFLVIRAKE